MQVRSSCRQVNYILTDNDGTRSTTSVCHSPPRQIMGHWYRKLTRNFSLFYVFSYIIFPKEIYLFFSSITTDLSTESVGRFERSKLVYLWYRTKILSGCVKYLLGIMVNWCSLDSTNHDRTFQRFANFFCKSTTPLNDFWTETGFSSKIKEPNQSTIDIFPMETTNPIPNCRYANSFASVYPGCLTLH